MDKPLGPQAPPKPGKPPKKQGKHPTTQTPPRKQHQDVDGKGSLQVLEDGFAVRNANNTRRLADEEAKQEIQIIDCEDRMCTKERQELADEENVAFIPEEPEEPGVPAENPDSQPTAAVQTLLTKVMPEKRGPTIPDIPAPTGIPNY